MPGSQTLQLGTYHMFAGVPSDSAVRVDRFCWLHLKSAAFTSRTAVEIINVGAHNSPNLRTGSSRRAAYPAYFQSLWMCFDLVNICGVERAAAAQTRRVCVSLSVCLASPAMPPGASCAAIILRRASLGGITHNNRITPSLMPTAGSLGCSLCPLFGSVGAAHPRINACRNANKPPL